MRIWGVATLDAFKDASQLASKRLNPRVILCEDSSHSDGRFNNSR
jgi:hypothetical protein